MKVLEPGAAIAVVAEPDSRLRTSLLRLDEAARARLATVDVDQVVARGVAHAEARAAAWLRRRLHANAWLALGLAVGVGVLLARTPRR